MPVWGAQKLALAPGRGDWQELLAFLEVNGYKQGVRFPQLLLLKCLGLIFPPCCYVTCEARLSWRAAGRFTSTLGHN